MKPARLLIAAVVLAGLSAAVYFSNKSEAAKEGKPAPDAAPKILALDEKNITQFEIKKRDGTVTVAKKDDSGKWSLTTPALPADQNACNAVTNAVTNLVSDRLVDENATDLASYGLAPALDEVTFTAKDGKKTTLLIGDNTPTGNNVYAKVDGDTKLYTMASFNKDSLDKDAKLLRVLVQADDVRSGQDQPRGAERQEGRHRIRPRQSERVADPQTEAASSRRIPGGRTGPQGEERRDGHKRLRRGCQEDDRVFRFGVARGDGESNRCVGDADA